MKHAWIVSSLVLLLAGCAATSNAGPAGDAREASGKEERELRALERKLEVARARLEVAELEQKAFEEEHANRIRHATAELAMAKARLARFRDADAPNKLASAKLDLQVAKDRAQEAADELAQIEIMYEEQDLDDLTAEFVVSRGRRAAERAKARIQIQEAELHALENSELPQEEERLKLEVDKAAAALSKAELEGEIDRGGKAIASQEARNEIERLAAELAEKGGEAKS